MFGRGPNQSQSVPLARTVMTGGQWHIRRSHSRPMSRSSAADEESSRFPATTLRLAQRHRLPCRRPDDLGWCEVDFPRHAELARRFKAEAWRPPSLQSLQESS
ncbi:hypothetical protein DCS_07629 [Drechmeria coniospora]|uniref:Uncharacterized protein n=1 Tax=Drechmeria coniospora TaxID=98403 RepID=A0A151GF01_DRECN|nr:hypothetical protein DCS_07629 [Drechmeria coniospora]KYK55665.1 hypothetical protein DCS_07629 [Drechmeria coniospora]ODA81732.1 hypothetical protein RJ55_00235 [Drechmeria coniospora]